MADAGTGALKVPRPAALALRGAFLTATGDPFAAGPVATRRYESDGMVLIEDGRIVAAGSAAEVKPRLPRGTLVQRLPRNTLLVPGFVDCHVHYSQLGMVASHGAALLDWLSRYTFPAERALADPAFARRVAKGFFDITLGAGTTTVASFCTVNPVSVEAFFAEAQRRGVRAIGGKVLMDRHAPAYLRDSARRGYEESRALLVRWHGRGRLGYAVTPRFAATSTHAQLEAAGALWHEHPGCWMQSHVAETREEIEWIRRLFPRARDYVDVYARFGLVGRRAIYGHGIHLSEREFAVLAATDTALAHCPSSNLFLGSGLFSWPKAKRALRPLRVGLATDVGAGTSLSMLAAARDAYAVARLAGHSLAPAELFYLLTRGGARALDLEDRVGSIAPGLEADLVLLDLEATPMLAQRLRGVRDLDEALFALFVLGDDRTVHTTWVAGRVAHRRSETALPPRNARALTSSGV